MTDDELDARLSDAGSRWRDRNTEAARVDCGAIPANDSADAADESADSQPLPLIPDSPAPKRSRRTRILVAASAAVIVAVVASVLAVQLGGGSSGGNSPAAQGGTPLTGTNWQLVATQHGAVDTGTNATLHVASSGELSGNDGCNAFGGRVSISADALTLGRVVHTMMGCLGANGTVGQAVDAVLSGGTVQYAIDGDTLTITKAGTGTLTYTAQRQQATPATTDPAAITGPDWVLNTVQFGDNIAQAYGTASSAPAGAQLKFADSRLVGSDGCNSFAAMADLGSGTVEVSDLAYTTSVACPDVSNWNWTLVLKGATHWTLTGDQLTITDAHNGKLVFTEVPDGGTLPAPITGTPTTTASK
ncbi:MAG TPA: META domain-containing protein [Jatrophihabitantaceae bacterium]|nr:META domain-containing protein [Jatrophihabitantaceae bacterium]